MIFPDEEDYIDPVKTLGEYLLTVDKPSRYAGGEAGRLCKKHIDYKTIIAFPDLYEIGMGNHAVRIIYNRINNMQGISCDRVFAPAPDFENILRSKKIPLYGLDTGIKITHVDLLMFTIGYELGLNGLLTMLDVSGIPLRIEDRNKSEFPIIIAGGPAVSNPAPFSPFIDAFWIGEAEAGFFSLITELAELKKQGKGRAVLLEKTASHPNIWVKGKAKALRAIMKDFSQSSADVYPIPSMKIIHHHGTVEIMRGCPNGCRFCHAGFWYRPYRQKDRQKVIAHADEMALKGGWHEISLSSLSSGDYSDLEQLIENMNQKFNGSHVSFQLPSLKVSGFTLSVLDKISVTRKSGLTFAIETPQDNWQASINKKATLDTVCSIINEAKKSGWKGIKFYFMIGLPRQVSDLNPELDNERITEEEAIVNFIAEAGRRTRMNFNININIFIPKPHTPYQRSALIDSAAAEKKFTFIRSKLKQMGHKVSVSDLLITQIESLISRGDEKAGILCEEAFRAGSRLDPWSEFINREKWTEILKLNQEYVNSVFSGKNEKLPWDCIDSKVTNEHLCNELQKSNCSERTLTCKENCVNCGVCNNETKPVDFSVISKVNNFVNQEHNIVNLQQKNEERKIICDSVKHKDPLIYRILFSFTKAGSAVFHGHLSLIEIFSMSFRRACIPVIYTQGFNPLAKIEITTPLSTGITSYGEIAAADFNDTFPVEKFINNLNNSFPEGIKINNAEIFIIKSGMKKYSLSSLLWCFSYANKDDTDYVNFKDDKVYRKNRLDTDLKTIINLKRNEVLARNIINNQDVHNEWASYFNVYRFLYPNN